MDVLKKNILLISKPFGITSFAVTNKVKHLLNAKKAGHAGTLDPMATGLMVIALNSATRFISYINTDRKRYIIQIQFGIETDTDDITGSVMYTKNFNMSIERIKGVVGKFIGTIRQEPPVYSAKKFRGKPLYKYAREGRPVRIQSSTVHIDKMKIISFKHDKLVLDVSCSKGTYMRSIARDIGRYLGTFATLSAITRISVGSFHIDDATTLGRIERGIFDKGFLSLQDAIDLPVFVTDSEDQFKNGLDIKADITANKVIVKNNKGDFIGIGGYKDNRVHPEKVLNEDI